MEYWDLYLPDGTPAGEIWPADRRIPDDRRTFLVHIFICNKDNRFLVQKRSMKKKYFPGIWDSTGGRVQAGETTDDAILREVREEVGLDITGDDLHFIGKYALPWRNIMHMYCVRTDFNLSDCTKQDEEVDELRLIDDKEALELFAKPDDENYLEFFKKGLKLLGISE